MLFEIVDLAFYLKQYRENLKLRRKLASTRRRYACKAAMMSRHSQEEHDLWGEYFSVTQWERSEIDDFRASKLIRKADWIGADISVYEREQDYPYPQRVFSDKAETAIKRIVKMQRRQNWRDWASIITPVVALIVGALGIVASIHNAVPHACK